MTETVLSLYDATGEMVKPWADAGYKCICVDEKHLGRRGEERERIEGNITWVGADMRWYIPPFQKYRIVFAFPPCTDLAVSGARWFAEKGLSRLTDALELVERARRICVSSGAPWMIENPVSTLSTHWRKPDCYFDPCDFGGYYTPEVDTYTKRTSLWVGGGFVMPEKKRVHPKDGSAVWLMTPSDDRSDLRSITPRGFARAVFMANAEQPAISEEAA